MSADKLPWFPLYAADFAMDTAAWSDEEVGAYFRLLLHQWCNGSVPKDADRRGRIVSSGPDGLADMWPTIGAKFEPDGNGALVNPRLEKERRKSSDRRRTNVARAKKAAAARWDEDEMLQASDKQCLEECLEHSSEQCLEECLSNASHSHSHRQKNRPQSSLLPTPDGVGAPATPDAPPDTPHQDIIALYHEVLPELVQVKEWTPARQSYLRSRWREDPARQTLDWWREFFEDVRKSAFLMGRTESNGRGPFRCSLEWLVRPKNFVKVLEGNYSGGGRRHPYGGDYDPQDDFR